MNGRCRHPLNEGRRCSVDDCRWWLPLLEGCRGCGLKEACGSYEEVDESSQLELNWDADDAANDGCNEDNEGGGETSACG